MAGLEGTAILDRLDGYDWLAAFEVAGPPENEYGPYNTPDIRSAILHSDVSLAEFTRQDIQELIAASDGENDYQDWLAAGQLKDGRYFVLRAGCDYTGWDCQSGGNVDVAEGWLDLVQFGMNDDERNRLIEGLL